MKGRMCHTRPYTRAPLPEGEGRHFRSGKGKASTLDRAPPGGGQVKLCPYMLWVTGEGDWRIAPTEDTASQSGARMRLAGGSVVTADCLSEADPPSAENRRHDGRVGCCWALREASLRVARVKSGLPTVVPVLQDDAQDVVQQVDNPVRRGHVPRVRACCRPAVECNVVRRCASWRVVQDHAENVVQ